MVVSFDVRYFNLSPVILPDFSLKGGKEWGRRGRKEGRNKKNVFIHFV